VLVFTSCSTSTFSVSFITLIASTLHAHTDSNDKTSLCSASYVTLLTVAAKCRPCSNRLISPACQAHNSKPTTVVSSSRQTDALSFINPAQHTQHPEDHLHSSYNNAEVRAVSGCPPLSNMVTERRLRFVGHITSSAPDEDHHHAVAATIRKPPSDWKRPPGRPNHSHIDASYTWKKAAYQEHWHLSVDMGMLKKSMPRTAVYVSSLNKHKDADTYLALYGSMSLYCENQHKETNVHSNRSLLVNKERMGSGHWLGSVLRVSFGDLTLSVR